MTYLGGFSFDSNIVLKTAWLRAKNAVNTENRDTWDNMNSSFRTQFNNLLDELASEDEVLKEKVDAIKAQVYENQEASDLLNIHHLLLKGQTEFSHLQAVRSNLILVGRGERDEKGEVTRTNTEVHEAIHRLTALMESNKESTEALEHEESVAMTNFSEMDLDMIPEIKKGQNIFKTTSIKVLEILTNIFTNKKKQNCGRRTRKRWKTRFLERFSIK